jgi:dienelactone hydrolase
MSFFASLHFKKPVGLFAQRLVGLKLRHTSLRSCALLAAAACLALPVAAQVPSPVTIASRDGTALTGWLFTPPQASRGTVVALHGCGGLYATTGARAGLLNARHQAIAQLLLDEGYTVLFPDSLTARGEKELCTQKIGSRRIDQNERRADALGALAWVAQQPWAQNTRTALLGWSHGGSAVLAATDATRADVQAGTAKPALAVAFYPGCAASLRSRYRPQTPLVLMLGEKDDWTPPTPCVELGKQVGAEVNVYADSFHGFDSPSGSVQLRTDVPNGLNPGQGVHVGPNPAARQAAYARLRVVLQQALQ